MANFTISSIVQIWLLTPAAIAGIWFLVDKIRGTTIVIPEISVVWFLPFIVLIGIILLMIIYFQDRRDKGTISPKLELGRKHFDLVIRAITEAKGITRRGDDITVYISSDTGLDAIYAQELKDILLKLQDEEKIITIKSFPDWLLPSVKFTKDVADNRILSILEPSRKHFTVHALSGFDEWRANYRAEIKNPKKRKLGQNVML